MINPELKYQITTFTFLKTEVIITETKILKDTVRNRNKKTL